MEKTINEDYLSFNEINETGVALSVYTAGACGSYSYNSPEDAERYARFAEAAGCDINMMIRPEQTHTDLVLAADKENGGEGVCREGRIPHDAIITNEKGLLITVASADCVPITVLDPVKRVAGVIHSGWQGTSKCISGKTIEKMKKDFGCSPENIICCVGPHICEDCYEVGPELIDSFREHFSEAECRDLFIPKPGDKYLLNLSLGVKLSLLRAGVVEENIHIPDYCTFHTDDFASWRRTHDRTKRILTGIVLL